MMRYFILARYVVWLYEVEIEVCVHNMTCTYSVDIDSNLNVYLFL